MRASSTSQTASTTGAECSMPVLTHSAPMSPTTSSICWRTNAGGTSWIPNTPSVFCEGSAVSQEERRDGNACDSKGMSRWAPEKERNKINQLYESDIIIKSEHTLI